MEQIKSAALDALEALKGMAEEIGIIGSDENFTGPGIVSVPQPLYVLPRDHAFHGGPFWKGNDLMEWNYISIIGTDEETGHTISIFWSALSQGWSEADKRPLQNGLFLWHDTETGAFKSGGAVLPGPVKSAGNSSDSDKFFFMYEVGDNDCHQSVSYSHADETFLYTGRSNVRNEWFTPYDFRFTSRLLKPGYVPAAYWGLESIGMDARERQNPETMYGLTYYYIAPNMEVHGVFTVDGKTHKIKGMGWFEHQWGHFRNTESLRYFYGYCRMNNGEMWTWRQYYGAAGDWQDPHPEVSRYQHIDTNGKRYHAFGPAFNYTPTRFWESERTGKRYPWWGKMETPKGTFYTEAKWPNQESMGLQGGFIEGTIYFREGSPDGPVVGIGFAELVDLPPQGPLKSRTLPEDDKGAWTPMS